VIADLSTSNRNASTSWVSATRSGRTRRSSSARTAKSFPFDVNHVLIQQYHHMGEGIDFGRGGALPRRAHPGGSPRSSRRTRVHQTVRCTPSSTVSHRRRSPRRCRASWRTWRRASGRRRRSGRRHRLQRTAAAGGRGAGRGRLRPGQGAARSAAREIEGGCGQGCRGGQNRGQADAQERPEDPYFVQRLALVT
jgi:hypothetical protein